MLTVEKYIEIHNKWSSEALSMSDLVAAINDFFAEKIDEAYDQGWDDCLADGPENIEAMLAAPQPDEQSSGVEQGGSALRDVLAKQEAFEQWAKSHGGINFERADNKVETDLELWPCTYREYATEIAWRAVANIGLFAPAQDAPGLDERAQELRCCNACEWTGYTSRMCGSVGPLCPDCGETTGIETGLDELAAFEAFFKRNMGTLADKHPTRIVRQLSKMLRAALSRPDDTKLLREIHQKVFGQFGKDAPETQPVDMDEWFELEARLRTRLGVM